MEDGNEGGSPHWRRYQARKCLSAERTRSPGPRPPATSHRARVRWADGGRTRNRKPRAGPAFRAAARLAAAPRSQARAAGIKQVAEPERVLISGRQLLGITLTEWFCLPAFSTVRRPRAMDQRRAAAAVEAAERGEGRPRGSRPIPPPRCPRPDPGLPGRNRARSLPGAHHQRAGEKGRRGNTEREGVEGEGAGRGWTRRKKRCLREKPGEE